MTKVNDIARMCHEVNRAWCNMNGETSQARWEDTPMEIKRSAISGVEWHIDNDLTPRESHQGWMEFNEIKGWVYGPVKDLANKTHPCMVPYDDLPEVDKVKDKLFKAIVDVFKESPSEALEKAIGPDMTEDEIEEAEAAIIKQSIEGMDDEEYNNYMDTHEGGLDG